ncbi:cell envelope integrity protein TolA [Desulfogranum japonicum]|uniref:cell envelope integrity protein TolA n=1 Tax=Desulfogranum japonicum TaxID=231447 RepID=UPI00040B6500|nr:cell envelope integrity protein TolA [Desulfogranum japonicum]
MSYRNFSEKDFLLQQEYEDNKWKLAIVLALVFHFMVLLSSLYMPKFFDSKPLIENVMTVDLVSVTELESDSAPEPSSLPKQVEPETVKVTPPPPESEEIPVPVQEEISIPQSEPEVAVEAKPVSVSPLKRKVKKASDTRLAEEREREKLAEQNRERLREERIRQQQQQEQLEKQEQRRRQQQLRQAQRRADEAAQRAREELAAMIREQRAMQNSPSPQRSGQRSGSASSQVTSAVVKQYYAILYQQVQSYWILPEMKKWDKNLEAIVVVTIDRSGRVLNTSFERKSSDPFFDQFVIKTINNAAPMPSFPNLMKESTLEVGLRFRPGQLVM